MYKVIIIGAGNIASGYDNQDSNVFLTHAHAFYNHSKFDLIGFVDTDDLKGNEAAKKWGTKNFSTIAKAYDFCPSIDVVCIAVPDIFHFDILMEVSIYKPKIVFTEKPLTDTLEQAHIVAKIYKKLKIPVLINFKRAFIPEIMQIIDRINQNEFGELQSCHGYYNKGLKHNGSHLLDLIIRVCGCKKIILNHLIDSISDFSIDDPSYSFVATSDKSAKIILKSFSGFNYPIFELDLHFTSGRVRFFNTGEKIEIYKVQESKIFSGFKFLQPKEIVDTTLHNSMLYAANNIYENLAYGKALKTPISDGIIVLQITDQILKSLKNSQCQN
jgi:predicted dehydrogenase